MVKKLVLLLLMPMWLMALPNVDVQAELDPYKIIANRPLPVNLMITHPTDIDVNTSSAKLDGKPLELSLVRKVPLGDKEVIEVFTFNLPAYKPGEYDIPIVSIQVGTETYKTLPGRFIVPDEGQLSGGKTTNLELPYLALEAEVKTPGSIIYPGQRVSLVYRYVYRGEVELNKEVLPLFNPPEGFVKIGEERVENYVRKGDSIREVTLDVQIKDPGTYPFPASEIEGTGYFADAPPQKMKAKTEPLVITVAPFPNQQQPATFEGAYGTFTIKTSLLNSNKLSVGDKLLLVVDIYGNQKSLQNLRLPKLQCQPGFSGLFSFDAVPIPGVMDSDKKRFVVPIRPTNDQVSQIPAVHFASYDPAKKEYTTVQSEPIPIQVAPVKNVLSTESIEQIVSGTTENWNQELAHIEPIKESDVTFLGPKDLRNLGAGTWAVLWLFPLTIVLLAGQSEWKKQIDLKKLQPKKVTANELFRQAMASQGQDDLFYWLISRALITQLFEKGEISRVDATVSDLPEGEIKEFLTELDRSRYGEAKPLQRTEVAEQARALFNRSVS